MSRDFLFCLVLASATLAAVQSRAQSLADGVYSAQQAARGLLAYTENCQKCHQEDLRGDEFSPGIGGAALTYFWQDLTLSDYFEAMRTLMPADDPASLPTETYADIVAYVLQFSGFPPGPGELPADAAALGQIPIPAP